MTAQTEQIQHDATLGHAPMSCGHPSPGGVTRLGVVPGGPRTAVDLHPHLPGLSHELFGGHFPKTMRDEPPNEARVVP